MTNEGTQTEERPAWLETLDAMRPSVLIGEIEERMDGWKEEAAALEDRIADRSAESQAKVQARMDEVRAEIDEIEDRLDKLRDAGEEQAEEIKGRLTALVIGLRRDLDRLKNRLGER